MIHRRQAELQAGELDDVHVRHPFVGVGTRYRAAGRQWECDARFGSQRFEQRRADTHDTRLMLAPTMAMSNTHDGPISQSDMLNWGGDPMSPLRLPWLGLRYSTTSGPDAPIEP